MIASTPGAALAVAAALAAVLGSTAAAAAAPQHMQVEILSSTMAPRPGSTVLVGFRMIPQPGWHGYWSNAGGSGVAPNVAWTAPAGVRFGPLLHPAPALMRSMGVVSYVHGGPHVLVSRMAIPAGIAAGTPIQVEADLSWAVCSATLCVPGQGKFALPLVAGTGAPTRQAPLLNAALERVPGTVRGGRYRIAGGKLVLELPASARLRPPLARFFPDANGFFDPLRAQSSPGPPVRITSPVSSAVPARVTGVVSDGVSSYRLALPRGAPAARNDTAVDTAEPARMPFPAITPRASVEPGGRPAAPQREAAQSEPPPVPTSKSISIAAAILAAAAAGLVAMAIGAAARRS